MVLTSAFAYSDAANDLGFGRFALEPQACVLAARFV